MFTSLSHPGESTAIIQSIQQAFATSAPSWTSAHTKLYCASGTANPTQAREKHLTISITVTDFAVPNYVAHVGLDQSMQGGTHGIVNEINLQ